jgi:hypothetical protein
MRGNGNTSQNASGASNIYNPQVYFGGAPIGQPDTSTMEASGSEPGSATIVGTDSAGAGAVGTGPTGASAVGTDANSVSTVSSTGTAEAASNSTFSSRIRGAVDRVLNFGTSDQNAANSGGFTAYNGGSHASVPSGTAAALGTNPTNARSNESANKPAQPGGSPSDTTDSSSAVGGGGSSSAKKDK